jgi:predicted RNase H-like nuclease (RuvC/YqgF family)
MKKAIEKKYHESGTVKNCTVNLFEETNNLLDQIFNPEKVNKIMKINKPLIELFKTHYIHPKQYDIKDIFIENKLKQSVPKNISDEEYIKELEEENKKLKEEIKDDKIYIKDNEDNFFRLNKEYKELQSKYDKLHNDTIDYDYIHVQDKEIKALKARILHLDNEILSREKHNGEMLEAGFILQEQIEQLKKIIKSKK